MRGRRVVSSLAWAAGFVLLFAAALPALEMPDFSGRWVLDSPSQPGPDVPRALSVSQRHTFPRELTILREYEHGTRSETYQVGIIGGTIADQTAAGGAGRRTYHSATMDAQALVLENALQVEGPSGARSWDERREVWWLDRDGRLHVEVTTRSAAEPSRSMTLVFRRRSQSP